MLDFALRYPSLFWMCRKLKRNRKTYLSYERLRSLIDNFMALQAMKNGGVSVSEFGVGRGGSALLLFKLVNKFRGHLTLYDVFARIPPPSETDGARAAARFRAILADEGPDYYGNIPGLEQLIRSELESVGSPGRYTIVHGRFEEILPQAASGSGPVDFAHVDCDWYGSVRAVLEFLGHQLSHPGILQIDDWNDWAGCRAAVEDSAFLQYPHEERDGALVIKVG